MISLNRTKPVCFIEALLFAIITGILLPTSSIAKVFTAEEEYKAQNELVRIQSCVDEQDYVMAQLILSNFQKNFAGSKCYKTYSERIKELAKKIREETKNIKVEDRIEYLYIPASVEADAGNEDISMAERMISQNNNTTGIAVLRVSFENADVEQPSVRVSRGSENQLYMYRGDGFSNVDTCQNGKTVFIGSQCSQFNPGNKDGSVTGNVIIGGIYHYPVKFKIKVQKGKATAAGEVIVRSIPQELCGNLTVKINAEKGLNLDGGAVRLSPSGFYSAKIEPIKDGCCLFSAIGPGNYNVAAASSFFGGPSGSASVVSGQTSEVTINAYLQRRIEFDWRFHDTNEPNNWLRGRKIMETKSYWQPNEEWPDVHYPVVEFGDWIGNTCKIRSSNGIVMPVDTNELFEEMAFPSNLNFSYHDDCPVKEGDIFAWRRDDRRGRVLEALIRINKITPVGMSDDGKSSSQ